VTLAFDDAALEGMGEFVADDALSQAQREFRIRERIAQAALQALQSALEDYRRARDAYADAKAALAKIALRQAQDEAPHV
jgi:hypothetical protein